jgi:hypothetical protein
MSENRNQDSFWTTLPGILTGVAAVITAVGGLIGGLYAAGLIGDAPEGPDDPTPEVTVVTRTPTDTPVTQVAGCVVTIANPLVSLKREPDTFSPDVIKLKPGDYGILEHREIQTPLGTESWFRIESEGRMGWIENSTFNIASKTSDCP